MYHCSDLIKTGKLPRENYQGKLPIVGEALTDEIVGLMKTNQIPFNFRVADVRPEALGFAGTHSTTVLANDEVRFAGQGNHGFGA